MYHHYKPAITYCTDDRYDERKFNRKLAQKASQQRDIERKRHKERLEIELLKLQIKQVRKEIR